MKTNNKFIFLLLTCCFCCACSLMNQQQEIKNDHEDLPKILHYGPAYSTGNTMVKNSLNLYLSFSEFQGNQSESNSYDRKWNGSETALMLAATLGDMETMRKLIKLGADINVTSNKALIHTLTYPYRETALHYAARTKQMEAYDFLIQQGANQQLKNTDGKTAKQLLETKL